MKSYSTIGSRSLMCCGCLRILGVNGTTVGQPAKHGGVLSFGELVQYLKDFQGKVAAFSTDEETDAAALECGWSIVDASGVSNHRCPDCVIQSTQSDRKGAVINWANLGL